VPGYRDSHRAPTHVEAYDGEFNTEGTPDEILWYLEQPILRRLLTTDPPARVLDFATGTGRISHFLEECLPSAHVDGVDISPEMLALARERCERVHLHEGDITHEPDLVPGPYDLITAFRFFLRAESPLRHEALSAIRDRLAPDGRLVANFHRNPTSLRGLWLRNRRATRDLPFLSGREVEHLLESSGFRIAEVVGYQHCFYRSFPSGPVRVRRHVDAALTRVGPLRSFGTSFIVVARRA
jgi:SAM-dependent methyltransferase